MRSSPGGVPRPRRRPRPRRITPGRAGGAAASARRARRPAWPTPAAERASARRGPGSASPAARNWSPSPGRRRGRLPTTWPAPGQDGSLRSMARNFQRYAASPMTRVLRLGHDSTHGGSVLTLARTPSRRSSPRSARPWRSRNSVPAMEPSARKGVPPVDGPSAWWRSAVLYQIYPRSFVDFNGDGVGDLAGVTAQLDDPVKLGSMPLVAPTTLADGGFRVHITDHCRIHPTSALWRTSIRRGRAHRRGLRVVLDFVPNHSSDRHPWFESPAPHAPIRGAIGTSGPTQTTAAARRTTGCRPSPLQGRRGRWTPSQASTTCIPTPSSSPT